MNMQVDGIATASPLGRLLANIMFWHAMRYIRLKIVKLLNTVKNCSAEFKILVYRSYVDDCFLVVRKTKTCTWSKNEYQ